MESDDPFLPLKVMLTALNEQSKTIEKLEKDLSAMRDSVKGSDDLIVDIKKLEHSVKEVEANQNHVYKDHVDLRRRCSALDGVVGYHRISLKFLATENKKREKGLYRLEAEHITTKAIVGVTIERLDSIEKKLEACVESLQGRLSAVEETVKKPHTRTIEDILEENESLKAELEAANRQITSLQDSNADLYRMFIAKGE